MRAAVSSLLEEVTHLPSLHQRKVGSLLGAAVADAAARPLHWVYDTEELREAIRSDREHPEFWPVSHSPFYSLETGDNSCYWDQAMAVMTALTKHGFSYDKICAELVAQLGPGSRYNMEARQQLMQTRMRGNNFTPIKGKFLHGGMIKFLENLEQGKKICGDPHIKETDGFCCSLPVAVKFAGQEGMVERVLKVTTTQSSWPVAVRHAVVASKIIEAFVLDREEPIQTVAREVEPNFPEISRELEEVRKTLEVDHFTAVGRIFGRPCYNPGSFLGALHAVQTSDSYQEAVRKTIIAGGCNCSRAFFIGNQESCNSDVMRHFYSQEPCWGLNMVWREYPETGLTRLKTRKIF